MNSSPALRISSFSYGHTFDFTDGTALTRAVAANDELRLTSTKPYRIGDPERKGVGLRIDPEMKSATLTSDSTDIYSGELVGYKPVRINESDSDIKIDSN